MIAKIKNEVKEKQIKRKLKRFLNYLKGKKIFKKRQNECLPPPKKNRKQEKINHRKWMERKKERKKERGKRFAILFAMFFQVACQLYRVCIECQATSPPKTKCPEKIL